MGRSSRSEGLTERLIQLQITMNMVSLMSQFKKRDVERKGGKKQENLSKKLLEENLDDLRTTSENEE